MPKPIVVWAVVSESYRFEAPTLLLEDISCRLKLCAEFVQGDSVGMVIYLG